MPGGLYVNYLKELQLHYKYLENDNFSMGGGNWSGLIFWRNLGQFSIRKFIGSC